MPAGVPGVPGGVPAVPAAVPGGVPDVPAGVPAVLGVPAAVPHGILHILHFCTFAALSRRSYVLSSQCVWPWPFNATILA